MRRIVFIVLIVMCALTLASALRAAAEVPQDARIAHPHSVNDPTGFEPHFASREEWEKRADELRRQTMVALGLFPMPPKTPLNPVIHGKIERDGYTVEKVFFASLPGYYVTGNLYRPTGRDGEKHPVVLHPYGHWPNGRFIWNSDADIDKAIKSGAESTREGARSPLQAGCAMLARMGCVVFHWDLVGYGDSTKIEHRQGFTDAESILRLQSQMGLQVWNGIRAIDFVSTLPDVDTNRIAVHGASGGGTQTIMLSAVDKDRVAAAFPMVMVSMNMQGGCVCENAPLLRVGTNNVELASLFAPKPQGAAGAQDWTHDFETRGLPEMKTIYGLYGAADEVSGKVVPFGHNYNQVSRELMYDFMNRALKLGLPTPVKEKPFEPIEPAKLSVFDAEHPRPSDEADAAGVRKWMTKVSDEQLDAMDAPTLRAALQAIVVDHKPSADEREYVDCSPPTFPSAGGEWNGTIARKGSGERVACKIIASANWNKSVVLWAHPDGCKSLSADEPAAKKLLDSGSAVLTVDMFPARPMQTARQPAAKKDPNPPYAGFDLGYNRSVLANRVHELLTAFGTAQLLSDDHSVSVIGFDESGPAALLACAVASHHVKRAAIDLNQFDFDKVTGDSDPMLQPGGLKYGGIYNFATLCDWDTLLCNARRTGRFDSVAKNGHITLDERKRTSDSMIDWLLR